MGRLRRRERHPRQRQSSIPLTNAGGEWTAFAAVKFDDVSSYQIVVDGDSASDRLAQFIRMNNAGKIEAIAFRQGDIAISPPEPGPAAINTWYDIVTVCSTTQPQDLRQRGSRCDCLHGGPDPAKHRPRLRDRRQNIASPSSFLNGQIADAGVVARALTDTEVASLTTYLASTHP
jgi:hypothetical protein